MCADGGSGNADFNFGINILGASRRIEPATDLSRKVVRQLALMSPARDSSTMFCAACISSERVGDSSTNGFEGGALTRGVCAAACMVTPAGLTTVSVSAPIVTESCPAPSNSAPRASRTSNRPTFTSKRSWPRYNLLCNSPCESLVETVKFREASM